MNFLLHGIAIALLVAAAGASADDSATSIETVQLETRLGNITIELYLDRAPLSAGSFIDYLDHGLLEESAFYRVVTHDNDNGSPVISVVQGGLLDDDETLPPIAHETTEETGLLHVDGAVSIARAEPGTGSAGTRRRPRYGAYSSVTQPSDAFFTFLMYLYKVPRLAG